MSEEGLAGGLADASGNPTDTTNATTIAGTMAITDPEGQPITSVLLTAPTAALTSGGVPVTWAGTGTASLTASADGQTVATISIDRAGHYSFALIKPIDQLAGDGENLGSLEFGVTASDGSAAGSGTLTIQIEDDAPGATLLSDKVAVIDTNVMIVLDVSGSMGQASGIAGLTRLQAAVESIKTLLDRYDDAGNVAVRLVTFSTNAKALGTAWTSVADAKTLLGTLVASGGTNYDEALGDAIAAFGSEGKLAGAQNVSYFLSDGVPTFGSGTTSLLTPIGTSPGTPATNGTGYDSSGADTGIQLAEETLWTNFLNANQINSFAIGMGTGITDPAPLNPIAYDGRSQTQTGGTVVTDFSSLESVLLKTANVFTGHLAGVSTSGHQGFGADGGHVHDFTVDGVTYTFDPAANGGSGAVNASNVGAFTFDSTTQTLGITTAAGGEFQIDMNSGDYTYRSPVSVAAAFDEHFAYTLQDRDGDAASSTGVVQVNRFNLLAGTVDSDAALIGGAGPDLLMGREGDDTLIGGAGDDRLYGGAGVDVFKWTLADKGTAGSPAVDTIGDFDVAARSSGGDVLDLRDLLVGETTTNGVGNLRNYLDFDTSSTPGSTVIRVSTTGAFAGGTHALQAEDQRIVLEGVDLRASLGLGSGASDDQILQELLNRNKLDVGP